MNVTYCNLDYVFHISITTNRYKCELIVFSGQGLNKLSDCGMLVDSDNELIDLPESKIFENLFEVIQSCICDGRAAIEIEAQ